MKKRILSLLFALVLLLTSCEILVTEPSTTDTAATTKPPVGGSVTATDGHVDHDDNGYCDDCGAYVILTLDLFALNDLHGKFDDTDSNEGVDELTTYLKKAKAANPNTLLLSSGDMWQGSSESNMTKGNLITDWMNEMDFVSMTLGNHEYDWGEAYIEANRELAEFPFLAINIFERSTNQRVDYADSSVMVEVGGIQIGIIGAIGDCYSSISANMVEDVYFKTGNDLTELVKAESEKLKKDGADLIIYSIHGGHTSSSSGTTVINGSKMDYYDTALSRGYVDLVFEGHTHQRYVMKDEYGVYHLQNGGDNKGISHATVRVNFANWNTKVAKAEFVAVSKYASMADDPLVDQLLQKYDDVISPSYRVLGQNAYKRSGNELRQLIAELYFACGQAEWGDDYNIVLGGGYLSVRSPGSLAAGEVTYSDLQMLFPFDNQLVLCSVSGRDLRQRFLETDNSDYFIHCGSYGEQVRNNINDNQTYYIIADTYSSSYAPNRLTVIHTYDANVFARDLLADYIADGGLAR